VKLVWTERAASDLEAIESYVACDDPAAAIALVDRLVERAGALRDHPRMGRVVPEVANPDIRELISGNYRLVYRIRGRTVEVLQVFEGHRLLREP
jgi:addiction module RelE/StbE family toxin